MNVQFEAVLFDCDGVLVDSEPITNGVLRQMLNEAGWALSQAECERIFIGKAVRERPASRSRKTGCAPFTPGATSACAPNCAPWTVRSKR